MKTDYSTIQEFIETLDEDRQENISKLRETVRQNLPQGFEEMIEGDMISYVVPHSLFPAGYHCNPSLPLPFLSIASRKNFVALYHMGLYADKDLLEWFTNEYPKHSTRKLDMGKSCIRFKKDIPFELIGELLSKMSAEDWIKIYEGYVKN